MRITIRIEGKVKFADLIKLMELIDEHLADLKPTIHLDGEYTKE